jgi:hypothetical protein
VIRLAGLRAASSSIVRALGLPVIDGRVALWVDVYQRDGRVMVRGRRMPSGTRLSVCEPLSQLNRYTFHVWVPVSALRAGDIGEASGTFYLTEAARLREVA